MQDDLRVLECQPATPCAFQEVKNAGIDTPQLDEYYSS